MKLALNLSIFFISLPLLLLSSGWTPSVAADLFQKKTGTTRDVQVVIRSDSLEIDNKKRIVSFVGSVEAQREDMLIKCQRMLVYYKDKEQEKGKDKAASDDNGFKIDRIVAKGGVRIDRNDGGTATADEAVYYEDEDKLVLQGRPVVKQGEDYVEGSVITLFLKEDRSVVEGTHEEKVRAVLSPKSRKR